MIICTRYLNNENYEGLEIQEVKCVTLTHIGVQRALLIENHKHLYLLEGYETVIYDGGAIIMRFKGPKCVYLAQDFDASQPRITIKDKDEEGG